MHMNNWELNYSLHFHILKQSSGQLNFISWENYMKNDDFSKSSQLSMQFYMSSASPSGFYDLDNWQGRSFSMIWNKHFLSAYFRLDLVPISLSR